jgi:K+-transporting ATPase ATPase C chain
MKTLLRPAISLFAVLSLVTGLAYPALVTGLGRALYPEQAAGSLITRDGQTIGSRLIGQNFSDPAHFWGRPSATAPQPYNGTGSSGANLGPLNPALVQAVQERLSRLHASDPDNTTPVPVDLVTSSASGLDPHISPAAAQWQAPRVARTRHLSEAQVQHLIDAHTEGRQWGFLGEPRVNVLELNLALDALPR